VVEEFLSGEEASLFAFIDGESCTPLVGAQVSGRLCEAGRLQRQGKARPLLVCAPVEQVQQQPGGLCALRCAFSRKSFCLLWRRITRRWVKVTQGSILAAWAATHQLQC
jgi:hypothetical protein